MNITTTVQPTEEPVTVDEAKEWARITDSAEDALVERLITRSRETVEAFTGRALLTQTVVQRWDCWPRWMEMLRAPVASVTSLQYIDVNGATQTVGSANYYTDLVSEPARLVAIPTYSWPMLQDGRPNAVILTYVAGLTEADDVPEGIKVAIMQLVRYWLDEEGAQRQQAMPEHIRDALWPYRIP